MEFIQVTKTTDEAGKTVLVKSDTSGIYVSDITFLLSQREGRRIVATYTKKQVDDFKLKKELADIEQWYRDTDYMCNKVLRGSWLPNDTRWVTYLQEERVKHARAEEIRKLLDAE